MFGIGANELIIILIFGFIIFGPDKLPGMAKTVGQAIAKFRNAQAEMNKVIKTEVYDPNAEDPFKNPLDALSKLESNAKKEDRGESFTERKARYDKQRAAKKAAEERKAELAAKKAAQQAAKEAAESTEASSAAGAVAAAAAGAADGARSNGADAAQAPASDAAVDESAPAKKKLSADELYGTKPQVKKPAKKAAADGDSAESSEKKERGATAVGPKDKKAEEAVDDKPVADAGAASADEGKEA